VVFKGHFRLNNIHKIITNFAIHLCDGKKSEIMGRLKSECPSGNFIVRTKPNAKGEVASRFILIFKHTLVAME